MLAITIIIIIVNRGARVYFNVLLILQDWKGTTSVKSPSFPPLVRINLSFLLPPIVLGLFCLSWPFYMRLLLAWATKASMSRSSQGPSIGSECSVNAQWIVQGQKELSPFIKSWGILGLSPEEWGLSEPFPEDAGRWACGSRKAYFCLCFQPFIIAPASCLMSTQSDFLLLVIRQNCSNIWKGPEIDSLIPQFACLSWWLVEGWADCFSCNNYLGASDNIRGNKQLERLETGTGKKKAGREYGKIWESSCIWGELEAILKLGEGMGGRTCFLWSLFSGLRKSQGLLELKWHKR